MQIMIHGEKCFSLPEAASRIGVARVTLWRLVSRGTTVRGRRLVVFRDQISRHYYLPEKSILLLEKVLSG